MPGSRGNPLGDSSLTAGVSRPNAILKNRPYGRFFCFQVCHFSQLAGEDTLLRRALASLSADLLLVAAIASHAAIASDHWLLEAAYASRTCADHACSSATVMVNRNGLSLSFE